MTLRFDINLSILFTELPLLERPAAARAAGFTAAEFWWPFGTEAVPSDRDVDAFTAALDDAGVRLVGLNFPDDLSVGARGLVSVPEHAQRFRDGIDVAVGIAERTGCRNLNALYGNRIEGCSELQQQDVALENLGAAAAAADRIGATVLIEALNAIESPAYPITSSAAALAEIDRVSAATGATNLAFLCDLYHLARMDEDLFATIAAHADRFGHVQIADIPARGEPDSGALDFSALFKALTEAGYTAESGRGWVGLEYKPSTGITTDSFEWMESLS
ncbi:hydroxypyruvate isomerase family protein [Catenulispora pinisilvae]|uniref:hydroxypyruvate isomerase family protein n=1 Tax=Catenulispora pinisilvae TaxID=2705253 RepID=UPI001891F1D8|nr:TIM barrel protein [Catenulispora pinisilvae]